MSLRDKVIEIWRRNFSRDQAEPKRSPDQQWISPIELKFGPPKNHPDDPICQCYPEGREDCADHESCRARLRGTYSKHEDPYYNRALELHCLIATLLSNIEDGIRLELSEPVALRWVVLLQRCVIDTGFSQDFPLPDWFENAEQRIANACEPYGIDTAGLFARNQAE